MEDPPEYFTGDVQRFPSVEGDARNTPPNLCRGIRPQRPKGKGHLEDASLHDTLRDMKPFPDPQAVGTPREISTIQLTGPCSWIREKPQDRSKPSVSLGAKNIFYGSPTDATRFASLSYTRRPA